MLLLRVLRAAHRWAVLPRADDSALTPTGERSAPLPALAVVNSLLRRAFLEGCTDMTRVKLQKMLFFLNGWHLAITGTPCLDRPFEVWKYGPVVRCVYDELRRFQGRRVTEYLRDHESFKAYVVAEQHRFYEILDLTWDKYIGIDAARLSTMCHAADTPWATALKHGSRIISDEIIKTYFIALARPARTT